jgi:hypothetical protein
MSSRRGYQRGAVAVSAVIFVALIGGPALAATSVHVVGATQIEGGAAVRATAVVTCAPVPADAYAALFLTIFQGAANSPYYREGQGGVGLEGINGLVCDGSSHSYSFPVRLTPYFVDKKFTPGRAGFEWNVQACRSNGCHALGGPTQGSIWIRPVASHDSEVHIFWRGTLDAAGTASLWIVARCPRPWVVADLSVGLTQGGDTGRGDTQDYFLTCDGRWFRRVVKIVPSPGSFDPGKAWARASFSLLDPGTGDPVGEPAHEARSVWLTGNVQPVLWDQTGLRSGARVSSDHGGDEFDSQGADDFVVPAGHVWSVTSVFAPGSNGSTHPEPFIVPGVNVSIYADGGAQPGDLIRSYVSVPPTTSPDDLTIPLSPALVLGPGTYWISVQADFNSLGLSDGWLWAVRQTPIGATGVWRSGSGLGAGNEEWAPLTDFEFDLRGSSTTGP